METYRKPLLRPGRISRPGVAILGEQERWFLYTLSVRKIFILTNAVYYYNIPSVLQRDHKTRIYPNSQQREKLIQTAGTARYVYNWALETWDKWYNEFKAGTKADKPNYGKLCALWTRVRPDWTRTVNRFAQDRAIRDLEVAYIKFFNKINNRPKFHKKGAHKDTFYVDNSHGKIRKDKIHFHIPSIGDVRMAEPLRFDGKILSYTVSTYAGHWYVSIRVEIEDTRTAPESACGVDVGMKTPAICSDNTTLILPDEKLRSLTKKLRQAQRIMMRRKKGSSRRAKALLRKQRIQEKINNIRKDCIHKFTTAVCKNHATVVVEDIDCRKMHDSKIKNIRARMQDSCMSEIRRQLEYKAINLAKADKWYPSTQLCSNCGSRQKLKLTQRVYKCPHCGFEIDRDLNAAINLSHYPGSLGE